MFDDRSHVSTDQASARRVLVLAAWIALMGASGIAQAEPIVKLLSSRITLTRFPRQRTSPIRYR